MNGSSERRLAAVLAADVAGYSRLAGADEERTLARLRALRGDLIDPAIAAHRGRVVKRAGDGTIVEFRSVIDAVRCALEVQQGMGERNAGVAAERQLLFRIGIHVGDVVGEADGDLMGDGVNIAARLEGIGEPGGICLSEDAWRQVRDRLQEQFTDLGEQSLKNIARPVRVYAIQANPNNPSPPKGGEGNSAPRLSIVVLPFANIGGDPEQEYFVDGVTESLTTDLSRISGSFVIARNTAFTFKGKPIDVKQLGRELNVRYVLEGSVQRGGNRLRVNVQLIDAETGNHLWAERFDKPLADLFDLQDEIVARLANQLGTQLVAAEARRTEHAVIPDAMDLYFRGKAALNSGATPEIVRHARACFEQALALAPKNADALAGLAHAHLVAIINLFYGGHLNEDRATLAAITEETAAKALTLVPNHVLAHYVMGRLYIHTDRVAEGIAKCEHAVSLDRNFAHAHGAIGIGKILLGRAEETEAHIQQAFRISPRDAFAFVWRLQAGVAMLCLGQNQEAADYMQKSLDTNRNLPLALFYLAAALALIGKTEQAKAAAKEGMALDPTFNIARRRQGTLSSNPIFLAQIERIYEGMREAGVPEG
jgi:TolB-like protein